jgi:adenine-specific DNA methylase
MENTTLSPQTFVQRWAAADLNERQTAQLSFLAPQIKPQFPSTRYQGSKAKLAAWIAEQLAPLDFQSVLDGFGGTGAVAYVLKQAGKTVTYNDLLRFNSTIGQALIENTHICLDEQSLGPLLQDRAELSYPDLIQRNFPGIYFTDEENRWLDHRLYHIRQLAQAYEKAIALFALFQACIVKRPYNLFHRKNLYVRLAEVERSFGNKSSWDRPFEDWFRLFVGEANRAVFDNGQANRSLNQDILQINGDYDLVYLDPPYISGQGLGLDYRDFYHFLEGMTFYEDWESQIDYRSKHRRLKRQPSPWLDKQAIYGAFEQTLARFESSLIVISYRSDGWPRLSELESLLKRYKATVQVIAYGEYQYVLSKNRQSKEVLLIGQ